MKKISLLIGTTILITYIGLLASQNMSDQYIDNKKESSVSVSTTQQKEIPTWTKPIKSEEIKDENVLFFFNSTATLDYLYKTIDEMNESEVVDTIVKGIITEIDYVSIEGIAKSILTINVIELYKGNAEKEIKVYEDGGYERVTDMIKEFKDHGIDLEKTLSKQEIESGFVEKKFLNAPHPKKDQQVILYLHKNTDLAYLTNSYGIVSSVYGKFTLDKNTKLYERTLGDMVSDFETSISENEMEKKLKNKFYPK